jgi:hypothetical protein
MPAILYLFSWFIQLFAFFPRYYIWTLPSSSLLLRKGDLDAAAGTVVSYRFVCGAAGDLINGVDGAGTARTAGGRRYRRHLRVATAALLGIIGVHQALARSMAAYKNIHAARSMARRRSQTRRQKAAHRLARASRTVQVPSSMDAMVFIGSSS